MHPLYQVQVVSGNVDVGFAPVKSRKGPTHPALTKTSICRKPSKPFTCLCLKTLGSYQRFKTILLRSKGQKHFTLASMFITNLPKAKTINLELKPA